MNRSPLPPSGFYPLPGRANLEHLRNEAKKLQKVLRRTMPEATLSAAQFAVARRYGFPSWRKLKAYLHALEEAGPRLIAAVRSGDVETIGTILDKNPELVDAAADLEVHLIRPSDAPAMRLLHVAIAENRAEAVRLLAARSVNLNLRNADGRLPLHDCFELGRDAIAEQLLAAGAEPDACAAAAYGMGNRLREILLRDPDQANDLRTGMSPLGWSVYGNRPDCAEILIEHGAIVDQAPYDVAAWKPAAHVANVTLARVFLAHGGNPNCRDEDGDTPIHAAIKSRLVRDPTEFVELLLGAGADRAIRNYDGRTALEEALLQNGKVAETYFPPRPTGMKRLERIIELLR